MWALLAWDHTLRTAAPEPLLLICRHPPGPNLMREPDSQPDFILLLLPAGVVCEDHSLWNLSLANEEKLLYGESEQVGGSETLRKKSDASTGNSGQSVTREDL